MPSGGAPAFAGCMGEEGVCFFLYCPVPSV